MSVHDMSEISKALDASELNEKLARWAGFTQTDIKKSYYWDLGERYAKWIPPSKEYGIKLPDFTSDLNACFRWLVPKLREIMDNLETLTSLEDITFNYEDKEVIAYISYWPITGNEVADNYMATKEGKGDSEALALCLAIEQMMDGAE